MVVFACALYVARHLFRLHQFGPQFLLDLNLLLTVEYFFWLEVNEPDSHILRQCLTELGIFYLVFDELCAWSRLILVFLHPATTFLNDNVLLGTHGQINFFQVESVRCLRRLIDLRLVSTSLVVLREALLAWERALDHSIDVSRYAFVASGCRICG